MSDFVTIAKASEIEPGGMQFIDIGGWRLVIVNAKGNFYALDGKCTHQNLTMMDGFITDESIVCPYHGGQFNLKTGAVEFTPPVEPLKTHEVKVEDDLIKLKYPGFLREDV